MVGCATSKDWGLSNNILELNCDSGKRTVDDGEDSTYDFQLTGMVFEYGDEAADNVSAFDFETLAQTKPQPLNQYRLAGKFSGDTVRTFFARIATFRETGSNGEARTYTVGFRVDGVPVLSRQT
ncbi:hypothetical protein MUK70_12790 [Dyadobacter chenwenxiniae]|uniref:Uncharacterized protein n=1 Tax=Dyadobacter chenwenxiniae TaxID=2906456 RepID=A0A9X1PF64_9BACT|nr:hypothetical protein [Dyadobacter chenwenxiniae]MCF0060120.1 hypothetical protein [Dyadobacter chenwenxiniae]UON85858.1 hypothetical protein MUK70_12790 [Dyadobacter chenwenxiniae]